MCSGGGIGSEELVVLEKVHSWGVKPRSERFRRKQALLLVEVEFVEVVEFRKEVEVEKVEKEVVRVEEL
jgi:hypothetical protein